MSQDVIIVPLAEVEGRHLLGLLDEFLELIDKDQPDSPAVRRLTPDLYPDDPAASDEYTELTRDDHLDRRTRDALIVQSDLAAFAPDDDFDAPLLPRDVLVAADHIDPWLRTLTAMRLVLASGLGVDSADDHDIDDPRFGVYDWLGYRLEALIQAADARDASS